MQKQDREHICSSHMVLFSWWREYLRIGPFSTTLARNPYPHFYLNLCGLELCENVDSTDSFVVFCLRQGVWLIQYYVVYWSLWCLKRHRWLGNEGLRSSFHSSGSHVSSFRVRVPSMADFVSSMFVRKLLFASIEDLVLKMTDIVDD